MNTLHNRLASLALGTLVLLTACEQPSDVPAGRKIIKSSSILLTSSVDLGPVRVVSPFDVPVHSAAHGAPPVISTVRLLHNNRGFRLLPVAVPVSVQPDTVVSGVFTPTSYGVFVDTLIINEDPALVCEIRATVQEAAVRVSDVDFAEQSSTGTMEATGQIINDGDTGALVAGVAALTGSQAKDFAFVFSERSMPFLLLPGESVGVRYRCAPFTPGTYTASMEFTIEYSGSGMVDSVAQLRAVVP